MHQERINREGNQECHQVLQERRRAHQHRRQHQGQQHLPVDVLRRMDVVPEF